MVVGAVLSVIGLIHDPQEFGFAWLLAFMFYLAVYFW